MKIRYHKDGVAHLTTKDFNPEGTPLGKFRLGIQRNKFLTGTALKYELMKPLYPDVPFSVALPVVRKPSTKWGFDWVDEMQPEGFVIRKKIWTEIPDVTLGEYELNLQLFEAKIREYLKIVEENYLPDVPDSTGYEWELVDMTKPYKDRYELIPVEVGRFNGNFYRESELDLYQMFVQPCCLSSNPIICLSNKTVKL
jgi:hypothetical protein